MIKDLYQKLKIYGWKRFISYSLSEIKYKFQQFIKDSYSQKGEDLIIDKILGFKNEGFYVDVGAYDPDRFNNTKRFYKREWRGINIEPAIRNYKKFVKDRKKDINLNIGIGTKEGKMDFYNFIPDTLSTFSKAEVENYVKQGYKLTEVKKVKLATLKNILLRYCQNREIDFISIDTEGFDLEVLQSNDWSRFRPKLVCIESIRHSMDNHSIKKINVHDFLINIGYKKVYDNGLNSIYQDKK